MSDSWFLFFTVIDCLKNKAVFPLVSFSTTAIEEQTCPTKDHRKRNTELLICQLFQLFGNYDHLSLKHGGNVTFSGRAYRNFVPFIVKKARNKKWSY